MKLQKIYRQLWMEVHPRPQSADTDQWYVDFANRLLPLFEKSELTGQMIHKNGPFFISPGIWKIV